MQDNSTRGHRAVYKRAAPYADDALNLPVANVATAIPYYERTFGFQVIERHDTPVARAVLARDEIQIGLVENGGDPTNEGCFFEVDDVDAAFAEIKGRAPAPGDIPVEDANGEPCRAFFVIAPDGLCYMIAQPIAPEACSQGWRNQGAAPVVPPRTGSDLCDKPR